MSKVTQPWSGRQQRQLTYISEFTTDIAHLSGKHNQVADCLSRAVAGAVHLGLDYGSMATEQATDPDVQACRSSATGLQLQDVAFDDAGTTLLCDISMGSPRPVVPAKWRRPVFDAIHSLSHPGTKASQRLVAAKFVWHGLKKDVRDWANTCVECQRAKVHRHTKAPLEQFQVPERRFDHVNIDLVGPLPPSQGYTHVLTMVDRTTRWAEAVPLSSITSADVARAFIGTWVSRFGAPSDISSDRGAQFTSELWNAVAGSLGVKLHRTTAYHPQSNGLCERFHRSMKASLRASLKDSSWADKLPWVMLGIRTAPKEDLQASSAELVYGQPLRVPGDFVPSTTTPWSATLQRSSLLDNAKLFAPLATSCHGLPNSHVPSGLQSAGYVFIRVDGHRGPLRPPYEGPFRVVETGDKHFVVDIGGKPESSLDSHNQKITTIENTLTTHSDELAEITTILEQLEKANAVLASKADDLENRSRRQNLRIVGLPEGTEGSLPLDFVSQLLQAVIGDDIFPKPPELDRAQRTPAPKPTQGQRSRALIVRFHRFQDKERVLCWARSQKGDIKFNDNRILFFPDFSAALARRRAAFRDIKAKLYKDGIVFALRHPARLCITIDGNKHLKSQLQ
ncbi:uncharacterized protein l1td1 [Odontesthes bonariensis]|uniref:uncharacterized protein l1td1 n=1 Tax=Odontesthes bonariensis TaxID=219752 RepID=UPI003F589797